jgi:Holliday junction resolvasome RuvABC endonuclease subunit
MKILALDISTKTGWALLEEDSGKAVLLDRGLLKAEPLDVDGSYPFNFLARLVTLSTDIYNKISELQPDMVVIEETNGSRARYTQKMLEYLHCLVLLKLHNYFIGNERISVKYISTSEWRKQLNLHLSKDQKKNNSKVSKAKREGKSKKVLGLKGRVTPKHLSVAWANEKFGLNLRVKDNDIADALALGSAALMPDTKFCDGK